MRKYPLPTIVVEQEGRTCTYKECDKFLLLGDWLDNTGSTWTSMHYNLSRAEAHYFKHRRTLSNKSLPMSKRLQAWFRSTSTIAALNYISVGLLAELRTWELKMLRRMLGLHWRPDEGGMQFNMRTAGLIHKWCSHAQITMLYVCVLKSVFQLCPRLWGSTSSRHTRLITAVLSGG